MGTIYKKGDTWYIRYDVPPGPTGKRQQVAKSCKGMNRKQAQQLLREIESDIVQGKYTPANPTSCATYLREWLDFARQRLSPATQSLYEMIIEIHLVPHIGKLKLDQITPLIIQRLYATLLHPAKSPSSRKPLAPKSVKNIHGVLHRALSQAVRWKLLPANPADAVDLPRQVRPQIAVATTQDIQRLLANLDSTGEWAIPLLIAISTGMRHGEILALQWQDYDPTKRTVIVRRAFSHLNATTAITKGTKTDRTRVIIVNVSLARALDEHYNHVVYNQPTDWICTRTDGFPLLPRHFTRSFERLAKRLNLPITLHGLRHTHATALIAAGIPVKVVSERLGHSTVVITQDNYTHALPSMQQQAAEMVEALWPGQTGKNGVSPESTE